jgi:hypothetical protein
VSSDLSMYFTTVSLASGSRIASRSFEGMAFACVAAVWRKCSVGFEAVSREWKRLDSTV